MSHCDEQFVNSEHEKPHLGCLPGRYSYSAVTLALTREPHQLGVFALELEANGRHPPFW